MKGMTVISSWVSICTAGDQAIACPGVKLWGGEPVPPGYPAYSHGPGIEKSSAVSMVRIDRRMRFANHGKPLSPPAERADLAGSWSGARVVGSARAD